MSEMPLEFVPAGQVTVRQSSDYVSEAHIWRSKIVEKCVEAERLVLQAMGEWNVSTTLKAPFSQKIEALKAAVAACPEDKRSQSIWSLLNDLRSHSDRRSEFVHSTITVCRADGKPFILFRNAADQTGELESRELVTFETMSAIHGKLSDLTNRLKQQVVRPSPDLRPAPLKSTVLPEPPGA